MPKSSSWLRSGSHLSIHRLRLRHALRGVEALGKYRRARADLRIRVPKLPKKAQKATGAQGAVVAL